MAKLLVCDPMDPEAVEKMRAAGIEVDVRDTITPEELEQVIAEYDAMVVRSRLTSFNREEEEAAKDLGASEWQTFRDILLPHMKPGLVAGALLAFTLSLDDFVITFFTSGPNTITFPVKVYSMVRFSVTPEVNAASAMVIAITVILTTIALKIQSRMGQVTQRH